MRQTERGREKGGKKEGRIAVELQFDLNARRMRCLGGTRVPGGRKWSTRGVSAGRLSASGTLLARPVNFLRWKSMLRRGTGRENERPSIRKKI